MVVPFAEAHGHKGIATACYMSVIQLVFFEYVSSPRPRTSGVVIEKVAESGKRVFYREANRSFNSRVVVSFLAQAKKSIETLSNRIFFQN